MTFLPADWKSIFVPSVPILEIIVRGTFIYLSLVVIIRALRKRQAGTVSLTDLLVIVLIADASQNAMAEDQKSIADAIVLVMTIVGWSYALDWLAYLLPAVGHFVHPPPLLLVENGRMLKQNMRKEQVTEEELMSQLREQGIEEIQQVKKAFMEADGHISIIEKQQKQHKKQPDETF